MNLLDLDDNSFATVKEIPQDEQADKLNNLGISPGVKIQRYKASATGNFLLVGIDERYFAITNDIAKKIKIEK